MLRPRRIYRKRLFRCRSFCFLQPMPWRKRTRSPECLTGPWSRARRSAACSRSLSFSHRSSSARDRFSRASSSFRIAAAFLPCSRSALSSAACALAVALSRRSRFRSRVASSRRRSASRRSRSFSKSAAAFRASRSLILEQLASPALADVFGAEPGSRRIPGRTGDRSARRSGRWIRRAV